MWEKLKNWPISEHRKPRPTTTSRNTHTITPHSHTLASPKTAPPAPRPSRTRVIDRPRQARRGPSRGRAMGRPPARTPARAVVTCRDDVGVWVPGHHQGGSGEAVRAPPPLRPRRGTTRSPAGSRHLSAGRVVARPPARTAAYKRHPTQLQRSQSGEGRVRGVWGVWGGWGAKTTSHTGNRTRASTVRT